MTGKVTTDLTRDDAPLDASRLAAPERAVLDRWADDDGVVRQQPDIAQLLSTLAWLRVLLTGIVRQAGHPARTADGRDCAPVPVRLLEMADAETLPAARDGDGRRDDPVA